MLFVSYSWLDGEPDFKVLEFVNYLRKSGYNAKCDVIFKQQETALNLDNMMNGALSKAKKVIIVLTKKYKEKADLLVGGVGKEFKYIVGDIERNKKKYILVSLEPINQNLLNCIVPKLFKGRDVTDLTKEEGYKSLFAKLNDTIEYKFADVAAVKPNVNPTIIK